MAKINEIMSLLEETAQRASASPKDWMNYLDTAARLYRYPFRDALLIHAQRPDAFACAELDVWNRSMNRWVVTRQIEGGRNGGLFSQILPA